MLRQCLVSMVALGLVLGCKKSPEPEPQATAAPENAPLAPAQPIAAPAPAPAPAEVGIKWHEPAKWQRLPKQNPMRKATYKIPAAEGDKESAELAVFYFGQGQGGDIEANMQRWVGQFENADKLQPDRSIRSSGKFKQHVIEIPKGTFQSGMPGQATEAKADYGLLGSIVETPRGNYFFKLTGPSKTVAGAKTDFFQLLDSIELEQEKR